MVQASARYIIDAKGVIHPNVQPAQADTKASVTSAPAVTPSLRTRLSSLLARVRHDLTNTYNHLCPINPLTHQRQFLHLPLGAEFALGRIAEFEEKSVAMPQSSEGKLQARTRKVFDALVGVLPCYEDMKWPASLRFVDRSVDNAYCAPGCRVTVYTGLEKSVANFLEDMKMKGQTKLEFTDEEGKKVFVDVSDVTYEDVMAALVGHELTHGVARHSGVRLVFGAVISAFLAISSTLLRTIAKVAFSKEVVVRKQPHNEKRPANEAERKADEESTTKTERKYMPMGHFLNAIAILTDIELIRRVIRFGLTMLHSRSNEYKADKYGMEIAHKAGFNAKGGLVLAKLLGKNGLDPKNTVARAMLNAISTHPLSSDRLRANYATLVQIEAMKKSACAAAA